MPAPSKKRPKEVILGMARRKKAAKKKATKKKGAKKKATKKKK